MKDGWWYKTPSAVEQQEAKMGLWKRILSITLMSVLASAHVLANNFVAPDSWFLEVGDKIVRQVQSDFGITLEKGLYYSNQRNTWYRDDVLRGQLIDEVTVYDQDLGDGPTSFGFSRNGFELQQKHYSSSI